MGDHAAETTVEKAGIIPLIGAESGQEEEDEVRGEFEAEVLLRGGRADTEACRTMESTATNQTRIRRVEEEEEEEEVEEAVDGRNSGDTNTALTETAATFATEADTTIDEVETTTTG